MKGRHFILIVFALTFIACRPADALNVHELNGSDLGLGVGARGIAMGGAQVALADDASAIYWNPAGMVQLPKSEGMLMMDVNPTRYSFKGAVLRPDDWRRSRFDWAVGVARTNRLKYIADGDWAAGNASHLIDLSMINVERNYVGGLNSRTTDNRFSVAARMPHKRNVSFGFTYIDFKCVTTFYLQGSGRTCQIVAYNAMDFGALYKVNDRKRFGLSLRNPFEPTKPRYMTIGGAWFRGRDTFTLDIERIYGQYGDDRRQVRFLMVRGGMERDMGNGWKARAGIILPLQAKTSTLGNIRSKLPAPKFGATVGAGYTWRDTTIDIALFGDPGKSYIENKKVFGTTLSLRQRF